MNKTDFTSIMEDTILPIAYAVSVLGFALSAASWLIGYVAGMAHTF